MISIKKVINCLRISKESITFAYELRNIHVTKSKYENIDTEHYQHYYSTSTTACGRK